MDEFHGYKKNDYGKNTEKKDGVKAEIQEGAQLHNGELNGEKYG